jgi:putative ABC transport system permease protein
MMRVLENTLLLVSALVFIAACLGVSAMLLASIRERSREVQLLRVIGAPPPVLFFLIELEALLITLLSCVIGIALLATCLTFLQDFLISHFGIYIQSNLLTKNSLYLIIAVISTSVIIAAIPAFSSYRQASSIKN